jgi:uncharacterized protein (DUF488 family)
MNFYTIGVYGSTEESFFEKLTQNKIDTFLDIRNRRGVRGAKYSYVNSKRLQAKFEELRIKYIYIKELAPTPEIRQLQKEDDKKKGILKRDRTQMGQVFKIAYKDRILNNFHLDNLLQDLQKDNSENIVLFCVEEAHTACHRSLVSEKIHNKYGNQITHL